MRVLTSAQMRAVDEATARAEGGASLGELMERAGAAVAKFVEAQYPAAGRVLVLCGKGNNGGDGLVAARYLAAEGVGVRVLLLGRREELKGEAATALRMLLESTSDEIVEVAADEAAVRGFAEVLGEAELLVDAVVGTGFKPPLHGAAAVLRDLVAEMKVSVLAVDLPSGWDADSLEESSPDAMRADAVVTFTAPKLAHLFGHLTGQRTFGPVAVAEIGSPASVVEAVVASGEGAGAAAGMTWTGSAKAMTERARPINSNKGMYGHVLLVAGSYGKAGAPAMASLAALRAGSGLVTAAVPESILNTVALITPELMTVPLAQGVAGEVALTAIEGGKLEKLMKGIKVLAIGPGLSTDGEAPEFVHQLVARTGEMDGLMPVVIDADGLNAFAGETELLARASGRTPGAKTSSARALRTVVLTPHPGEMARLMGTDVKTVEADRVGNARRFATEHGLTVVLKGWRTLVAHPDGRVAVNTTGNPSLAKGGSGDILTGIVAAMLAQYGGEDAAMAVEAAVYLHGLAGDFAVVGEDGRPGRDEHTVLATDTIAHLSDAFRYRVRDEDGMTWICGVRAGGEVEVGI